MRYRANGFFPVSFPPARRRILAATVTIVEGDALHDDGSGYATNATTAFATTFLGIAAESTTGDSSSVYVEYYPRDLTTRYIVPVAANTTIAQTNIGTIVDLEANDDIDISDTTIAAGPGFFIDAIDISEEAVAANTYGYAIGHFEYAS